jgi:hypothetical protein
MLSSKPELSAAVSPMISQLQSILRLDGVANGKYSGRLNKVVSLTADLLTQLFSSKSSRGLPQEMVSHFNRLNDLLGNVYGGLRDDEDVDPLLDDILVALAITISLITVSPTNAETVTQASGAGSSNVNITFNPTIVTSDFQAQAEEQVQAQAQAQLQKQKQKQKQKQQQNVKKEGKKKCHKKKCHKCKKIKCRCKVKRCC